MTDIHLRPLRDDDAAAIADLFNQPKVINGTLRIPFTPEDGVKGWLSGLGKAKRMIIAEADDRAVGFILVSRFDGRMSHCGDIFIAIHDDYHGRGIGAALMTTAIDIADNWMGLVRLQLEVLADNPGAIHLYENFGFVIEGRAKAGTLSYGKLIDHFYMARIRPAPARRAEDEVDNP